MKVLRSKLTSERTRIILFKNKQGIIFSNLEQKGQIVEYFYSDLYWSKLPDLVQSIVLNVKIMLDISLHEIRICHEVNEK